MTATIFPHISRYTGIAHDIAECLIWGNQGFMDGLPFCVNDPERLKELLDWLHKKEGDK